MTRTTAVTLVAAVVALALTQIGPWAVLVGAAIGGIGYVLMPRDTIQR